MIWRLTYCNKEGVEARIDIIKGSRTPVRLVEGSGQPFTLSYKLDKNDKSGHIMTSSADIEFFETDTFNIDNLKTSNETELKVEYFEGNVLTWSGFILPDFFSREIGSPNIVRMTASDRLTAIKGITLSDLPTKVSLRDLIELCLAKTGLTLGLTAQVQLFQGSTNILDSEILSQRFTDVRGRSISCYDILMSIMVGTNSTIMQRKGLWAIYNKLEHEQRTPTVFFDKVEKGAIRTIQPVASSVGVYNEFGGSKTYPENYNFKSGGAGWAVNFPEEMSASFSSKNILGFDVLVSGGGYQPVYGTEDNNPHAVIYGFRGPLNYLKSEDIPIPSGYTNEIDIKFDINASGPIWNFGSHQRFSVFAVKGERIQVLASSGFVNISQSSESEYMHMLQFEAGVVLAGELARVSTNSLALSGKLVDYDGLDGYSVHIRLYSSDRAYATIVNFASINFSPAGDSPKGNLYKTTQGSNFTKQHDIETTIFGDYITGGLNGYFYNYPIDDSSNLFLPDGTLSLPQWITAFDPTERPLLHHISRQKSSLFSVAHDILTANINVESFDPLAIFQDCKGNEYVVISASFDFLRSKVDVGLEQIAYDNIILKRDFIYSYFGEGEDTIKSIGGIAGGGGGGGSTGGGLTPEQLEILSFWKKDPDNPDTIFTEMNAYSTKELSAYGAGDGGGGGGGIIETVYGYGNLGQTFNNNVLTDTFNAYTINQINTRLVSVESGSATTVNTTGTGNAVTSISKAGSVITANKDLAFLETSIFNTHNNDNVRHITGAERTKWDGVVTDFATHIANKSNPHSVTKAQVGLSNVPNIDFMDYGLGGDGLSYPTGDLDFKAPAGLYSFTADTLNQPPTASSQRGGILNLRRTGTPSQFQLSIDTSGNIQSRSDLAPVWKNYWHNENLRSNSENEAFFVDRTTNQTIGGVKIFEGELSILSSYSYLKISRIGGNNTLLVGSDAAQNAIYSRDSGSGVNPLRIVVGVTEVMRFSNDYNVGIGTTSPTQKLHVVGNILSTGTTTTTKVIFNSAGWSMEQVGSELQMKHNNLIAARFLADGSIVGLGEITAYGASTGGEGVSLLRTGGTMTGNLTMSANIIMNSGRAIGVSNLPLRLLGNALTYNASNVLTEANTATQIKMGNGWTIEQTVASLTIRKDGVIKGTFNA